MTARRRSEPSRSSSGRCRSGEQPEPQAIGIERPVQFHTRSVVAQDGNPDAIACFKGFVIVDEDGLEIGRVGLREDGQGEVAELAVVALEEDERHTLWY